MKEKKFENILKKKSIAFKASFKSDDSEDDLALISHKFKDFLNKKRVQKKDKKNKRIVKKKKILQATWDDSDISIDEETMIK